LGKRLNEEEEEEEEEEEITYLRWISKITYSCV